MRWLLVLALFLATCGESEPAPAARGALVLDIGESMDRAVLDARVLTEIEVLRSRALVERALTHAALDRQRPFQGAQGVTAAQRAIRASRRGDSLVIDVGVVSPDPELATTLCNSLMQQYIEQRYQQHLAPRAHAADRLAAELERLDPADERRRALEARVSELELERAAMRSDARVLERCEPRVTR